MSVLILQYPSLYINSPYAGCSSWKVGQTGTVLGWKMSGWSQTDSSGSAGLSLKVRKAVVITWHEVISLKSSAVYCSEMSSFPFRFCFLTHRHIHKRRRVWCFLLFLDGKDNKTPPPRYGKSSAAALRTLCGRSLPRKAARNILLAMTLHRRRRRLVPSCQPVLLLGCSELLL